MINILIPMFVLIFIYVLFKKPRQKAIDFEWPEGFNDIDKRRLLYRLGHYDLPPYDRSAPSLKKYLDKLLPYMVIRCRSIGFPKGTKVILRINGRVLTAYI